uniref:ALF transcription elongation factor 3 n=1 Tax=Leptobrachium leishanense TaxID=445787 RepID=A0A8C5PKI5_9ANUR
MDSFDLDLLQEWDLDDLCVYDQDKNVLRRKEWERKTPEIRGNYDDFLSNYPLFSEPYKTNKGDELSSRIQSTLGNYDEMKELLIDSSNQSQLVGIPQSDASHNPVQRVEEHFSQHPREPRYTLYGPVQSGNIALSVQLKKQTTMNWTKPGQSSEGQEIVNKDDQRFIDTPVSDFKSGHQKHAADKNRGYSLSPSSLTSASNEPQQNMLPCALENPATRQLLSKVNSTINLGKTTKENSRNKCNNGTHSAQNFPASIVTKLNAVQQKPTAYVRPMDGQDQAPNESPKLKSSTEGDIIFPSIRGFPDKAIFERMQSDKRDVCPDPDLGEPAPEEAAIRIQSDSVCSGVVEECSSRASGVSIKGSSTSSSESDTSSESDSESASSSTDSENCKPSGYVSPEREAPTSNKWQLDKWLNKVNPHKTAILSHVHGPSYEGVKRPANGCEKLLEDCQAVASGKNTDCFIKEDQRSRTVCTIPNSKVVRVKSSVPIPLSIPTENISPGRTICRKLTRRAERTPGGDNLNCNTSFDTSSSQENFGNGIPELNKSRLVCSRSSHKKVPSPAILGCERRQTRGPCRPVAKVKCPHESSLRSLDNGAENENEQKACPLFKNISATSLNPTENTFRVKDCGGDNITRPNPHSSTNFAPSRTTCETTQDPEEQFYKLVPFGRNDSVHSSKGSDGVKSLWVRIDLSLLSRIPGPPQDNLTMNSSTNDALFSPQNRGFMLPSDSPLMKMRRKRKFGSEGSQDMKKNHMEMERYTQQAHSHDCPEEVTRHSTNLHSDESSTSKFIGGDVLPQFASSTRCRKIEGQSHAEQKSLHVQAENITACNREDPPSDLWPPLSNGHKDSRSSKPLLDGKPRNADYFMQEAKRMKHKADAMTDKFDKVLNYTEAALSFIECGNAMEHGPMESKSPYTMYSETVELIRYALRLKSHSGPNASTQDKKITALCYRCLALLYWRMFRLKRDHAVKYSKALVDYFKSSPKVAQASSNWNTNGKMTCPTSPSPSSMSSAGSQATITSMGAPSSTTIISIPQRIHQMAANHVSITNSILHSYDYWEIADNLTKDDIEFFNELDALMGPITLHSSMEHLVEYTRQGLHWIRHNVHSL